MAERFLRLVAVGGLSVIAALACGSGPSDLVRSGGKYTPGPELPLADVHDAFTVPPDRALIGARVAVRAPTFQQAADALRAEQQALETALSDAPGCAVRVLDYARPAGWNDRWQGAIEVVVDADLVGLGTVGDRMDRIDACAKVLADRQADDLERSGAVVSFTSAAPTLVVDDPQQHLPALVAREVARLKAASALTGASQLHPEDLRCVPDGRVTVGRRLVSGVELTTTVSCRIEGAEPPQG